EVGGSCQSVDTGRSRFIVDCGAMGSGGQEVFPADLDRYSFLILTHAHSDHCGLVPELFEKGFRGRVYCTPPTAALVPVMLRMARSFSREKVSKENFDRALESIVPVEYGRTVTEDDVSFTFREAGHLLGAAFVEIDMESDTGPVRVVFSGDLGSGSSVLLESLKRCDRADYVVIESTYGGRSRNITETDPFGMHDGFIVAAGEALRRGGDVLVPAFTLGRTQEIIAVLQLGLSRGMIPAGTLIYSDSPTANRITRIYRESGRFLGDRQREAFGGALLAPTGLREVRSRTSMKVHDREHVPSVFISSSGDLEHANSPRHLVRMCKDPRNLLCLVGWQPPGSVGYELEHGVDPVLIRHREGNVTEKDWISPVIEVKRFDSFSGHADQNGLVEWLASIEGVRRVFIVHGEPGQAEALADRIEEELGTAAVVPRPGEPCRLAPVSSRSTDEDSLRARSAGGR
ncbi:MAG TPA: MBL fold metallo-hydrolase, partial [Candidatus Krumholzibacterium sp.]|nr:MBL fold metallo-hydrolase [Candidatus Krumholzibacterium sp.]